MSASRQLVVCVDDFGLHAGVNQAVLDLLDKSHDQADNAELKALNHLLIGRIHLRPAA